MSGCICVGGPHKDAYKGEWEVPEKIHFCVAFGHLTVDFRKAQWVNDEVSLKARCMFGSVTIIVPDDGVKVDTTCAGCCTGWVWCGGYMGEVDAPKAIILCEYAWFGLIKVVKASDYEQYHPPEDEEEDNEVHQDAANNELPAVDPQGENGI